METYIKPNHVSHGEMTITILVHPYINAFLHIQLLEGITEA